MKLDSLQLSFSKAQDSVESLIKKPRHNYCVQVSAKTLIFPRQCVCCGEPSETERKVSKTTTKGKKVVRKTTRFWYVPYCNYCVKHIRARNVGFGFLLGTTFIAFGVSNSEIIAATVGFPLGLILLVYLSNQVTTSCACLGSAADYRGAHGTHHTFIFKSKTYTKDFMKANRNKLVNVSHKMSELLKEGK